ncbi:DUF3102 domain-containing protein [Mesorhizobium sp.]|uniref:DUF3102 domain-containing protein n=1 Tax=Mesorhizobium sp. TaxID=1871066 RepID=UPI0025FD77FB|nr:DUF3102 domain-containing protein [Mesorhizobium sp.]
MTELAPKGIEVALEDLDLNSADLPQVEASIKADAGREPADRSVSKAVPLSASFRLPIYNAFQPAIAKLAKEAAGRIRSHSEIGRRSVVEIGKELLAIKGKLGHGLFGKWIEAEFDMTAKTAQNYMNRARMAEKSEAMPGLSDTALQLLSAPGVDAVRDKIIKTITDDINGGKPAPKTKIVKEMISKATGRAKAASVGMSPAATSTPAKATRVAIPASASTTTAAKSEPAEVQPSSATNKAPTVATASTASDPTPATAEQAAAAARLIIILRNVLPKFAKLYDIAGHEAFRKAMADALKAAVTQPQQTKQAA